MFDTLARNWRLLATSGILHAAVCAIYFGMQGTGGPVLARSWNGAVVLAGQIAMLAGAFAIAAALWRSRGGRSWALAFCGLSVGALGLIQYRFTRVPIPILAIAVLVIAMIASLGVLELRIARVLGDRGRFADSRIAAVAGVVSMALVLPSIAFGFRWIPLKPGSHWDFLWLGTCFGFAGACMVLLAIRFHSCRALRADPAPA